MPTHTEILSSNFADGTTLINIEFQFTPLATIPGKGSIKILLDQSITGSGVTSKLLVTRLQLPGLEQADCPAGEQPPLHQER